MIGEDEFQHPIHPHGSSARIVNGLPSIAAEPDFVHAEIVYRIAPVRVQLLDLVKQVSKPQTDSDLAYPGGHT
jgi:hypothetical protein